MKEHPLLEVFGFSPFDNSEDAEHHRIHRLCPFNNGVPNCTKDKKRDPLGVCSILHKEQTAIVCPVRFRERWMIAVDAAEFFFPKGAKWTTFSEIKLTDVNGKSVGKIDQVLVSYDDRGFITHYGALEVQSVYISGNIRTPFEMFMKDREEYNKSDWSKLPKRQRPKPDTLSSLKRMIPQLLTKSQILRTWGRKMAVAVDSGFFEDLPRMKPVADRTADLAWLVYDLKKSEGERLALTRVKKVLTDLRETIAAITKPEIGDEEQLMRQLQKRLSAKLEKDDLSSPR